MEKKDGTFRSFQHNADTESSMIQAIANHRNAFCRFYKIEENYPGDFIHDYEYIRNHPEADQFILMVCEMGTHIYSIGVDLADFIVRGWHYTKSSQATGYFILRRYEDKIDAEELTSKQMEVWVENYKKEAEGEVQ